MEQLQRNPVTGIKLSSVVPARVTGENRPHELTAMDLAVKLHYIRAVYFFNNRAVGGLTVADFKKPTFRLLEIFNSAAGRIRRSSDDDDRASASTAWRPYIRRTDSGVRIVEGLVEDFTVDEWLAMNDRSIDHQFLVYDHVLGPDLEFSPLIFLQITRFKCGGVSVGLSWAHILGDAFSASAFMNTMGRIMMGQELPEPIYPSKPELVFTIHENPLSIDKIDPVGNYWLPTNKCKMGRHTFCLSSKQIEYLVAINTEEGKVFSNTEILYSVIWRSVLNIRGGSSVNVITICDSKGTYTLSNENMVVGVVEADGLSEKGKGVAELATLIAKKKAMERRIIEETIETDGGVSDFILYGTKLTFVNLEEVGIYGYELNGEIPDFVNYTIHGVGDKGAVLIFPGPREKGEFAKTITVVVPEEELAKLKEELKNYWVAT